ncbi:MAG: hypothetical protein EBT52_05380 [Flavobacteriia bacterium]|nr:hypothetical protein [Flavobacteriia bacterium]
MSPAAQSQQYTQTPQDFQNTGKDAVLCGSETLEFLSHCWGDQTRNAVVNKADTGQNAQALVE